jgi:hypothetical protein
MNDGTSGGIAVVGQNETRRMRIRVTLHLVVAEKSADISQREGDT